MKHNPFLSLAVIAVLGLAPLIAHAQATQITSASGLAASDTTLTYPAGLNGQASFTGTAEGNTLTLTDAGNALYEVTSDDTLAFPTGTNLLETEARPAKTSAGPLTITFSQGVSEFGLSAQSTGYDSDTITFTAFHGTTSLGTFTVGPLDNTSDSGQAAFLGATSTTPITSVVISSVSTAAGYSNNFFVGPITFSQITPTHSWTAVALAAGPDGKTRILWDNLDGTATVWTLNADGSPASYSPNFGPIAGWTAKHISVGPDNATHILWTNTDGRMTVWTLPPGGSTPSYGSVYGPIAGWTATSIATGSLNKTHVLWVNTDGRMTLWTVPASGTPDYGPVYGPYSGWTAKAIASGFTSNAHVLWTNTSGAMTLWTAPLTGSPTYSPVFGPFAGWTATSVGVDASGAAHVLWDNTGGAMTLWTVPATGSPTYSPVFGPYAGYSAVDLSLGTNGNSHILWDNVSGAMTPWTLSPANAFLGTFPTYGPY